MVEIQYSQTSNFTITLPSSVALDESGSRLYGINLFDANIETFSLSTNYDVTTGSNTSTDSGGTDWESLLFNDTGSKLFILDYQTVDSYSLSTNYDISSKSSLNTFDISSQSGSPADFCFNDDGKKLFIVDDQNADVYSYELTSAFDVSTASYLNTLDVSEEDSTPEGVSFKKGGNILFVAGDSNNNIFAYELSTSFDLSSASYNGEYKNVSSQDTQPRGLFFANGSSKLYLVGNENDKVYSYYSPVSRQEQYDSNPLLRYYKPPFTFSSGINLYFTNQIDNYNVQIVQVNKALAALLNALYSNASDYQSGQNVSKPDYARNTYKDLPKDNSATSTTLNDVHGDLDSDINDAEDIINDIGNSLETRFSNKQL